MNSEERTSYEHVSGEGSSYKQKGESYEHIMHKEKILLRGNRRLDREYGEIARG